MHPQFFFPLLNSLCSVLIIIILLNHGIFLSSAEIISLKAPNSWKFLNSWRSGSTDGRKPSLLSDVISSIARGRARAQKTTYDLLKKTNGFRKDERFWKRETIFAKRNGYRERNECRRTREKMNSLQR